MSRCSSRSRFRICACTETSSAEVGSSQTISRGSPPARGRWRCAGAARRRTRADSARARRAAGPTWSTSACGRSARRAASISGRRVDQALLDDVEHHACAGRARPNGSWKTICTIARRAAGSASPSSANRSRPSSSACRRSPPAGAAVARSPPVVVLPQPTRPPAPASAGRDVEGDSPPPGRTRRSAAPRRGSGTLHRRR